MAAQVLRSSVTRRPLCSSCLLSRRTSAYYSQFVAGRIRDSDASSLASTGATARKLTRNGSNSYSAVTNARNPSDLTPLDRYLASIKAADLEPTLDDIERCKPEGFSRPDSSRYATEYTNLLEMLCRSFSKDQLRRFTELYKLDPIWTRSSRRKTEYAESIIEKAWGWPSLKEIERKRRDATELLIKSFTVTPSQLFLIMGRDGTDLLQLSMQYNVHISLMSSPLALRVEGLRGSLKGLSEHISSLKKGIIDEIFELPTGRPIRPDLLQRVSRLAGAYVENHGHRGKVRICAKHPSDIITAKQLALRASLEVGTRARTVCFDPPDKQRNSPVEISEPHRYSLYPFVTPASFPWTMHSGGVFRLRRVADWLGVDSYEDIASTGGLADNPSRFLSLGQDGVELGQLVCPAMSESTSSRRRIVTASLGHILISSGDSSQRATIFPPLNNASSLPDILKWVESSGAPLTFTPSIPPSMMAVSVFGRRDLHRLIYRTLPQITGQTSGPPQPQHVLKLEIELSGPLPTSAHAAQDHENAPKLKGEPFPDESTPSVDPVSYRGSVSSLPQASTTKRDLSCQVGEETRINVMLPDRPLDVQLCIFEWDDVGLVQQPQVLREYAEQFHHFLTDKSRLSRPDPPSTFSFEGRTYYLHDSLSLRQRNYPISLSSISNIHNADTLPGLSGESIVDLQSAQKTERYQVKLGGTSDEQSWKHFLAACDQLSIIPSGPRGEDKLHSVHQEN